MILLHESTPYLVFAPVFLILLARQWTVVDGHARFLEPPSRASMWRMGFAAPEDYQDHESNCGGMFNQWTVNGGRCGVCGDRWDVWPRPHEHGGRYGNGEIVRRYSRGQVISSVIEITTAHEGFMEFRVCALSSEQLEATQPCLNRNILSLADGSGSQYKVGNRSEMTRVKLRLPDHLTCQHCVIQWRYRAGNNWGRCEDGTSRMGCGAQEEFRGCADVSILDEFGPLAALADNRIRPGTGDDDNDQVPVITARTEVAGILNIPDSLHSSNSPGVIDIDPDHSHRVTKTRRPQSVDVNALGETFEKGLTELFLDEEPKIMDKEHLPSAVLTETFQDDSNDHEGGLSGNELIVENFDNRDYSVGLPSRSESNGRFTELTEKTDTITEQSRHFSTERKRITDDGLCFAVGIWATVPGMDSWCENNCRSDSDTGFGFNCPSGMCQCLITNNVETVYGEYARIGTESVVEDEESVVDEPRVTEFDLGGTKLSTLNSLKAMPRDTLHVIREKINPLVEQNLEVGSTEDNHTKDIEKNEIEDKPVERSDIKALLTELAQLREQKIQELLKKGKNTATNEKKRISLKLKTKKKNLKYSSMKKQREIKKEIRKKTREKGNQSKKAMKNSGTKLKLVLLKPPKQNINSRGHRLAQLQKDHKPSKTKTIRLKLGHKYKGKHHKKAHKWLTHIRCTATKKWVGARGIAKWCHKRCSVSPSRRTCPHTVCSCSRARVAVYRPEPSSTTNRTLVARNPDPVPNHQHLSIPTQNNTVPGIVLVVRPALQTQAPHLIHGLNGRQTQATQLIHGLSGGQTQAPQLIHSLNGRQIQVPHLIHSLNGRLIPAPQPRTTAHARQIQAPQPEPSASGRHTRLLQRAMNLLRRRRAQRVVVPLEPAPNTTYPEQPNHQPTQHGAVLSPEKTTEAPPGSDSTNYSVLDDRRPVRNCRGLGKWRHSFAMDYWCEVNCASKKVNNCPKSLCKCRGYARLVTL